MTDRIGFGAARFPPLPGATRAERIERAEQMLGRALNLRTVVAVVGGGCSQPLGYPDWAAFVQEFLEDALTALEARPDENGRVLALAELRACHERLLRPPKPEPVNLMYYLGICRRLLDLFHWDIHPFARYVERRFGLDGANARRDSGNNPHQALAELFLWRFVTTNYDCELELALAASGKADFEDFYLGRAPDPKAQSFTQGQEGRDPLVRFTLSRPLRRAMVFHCHGRFDRPESIVATEKDYQRWYLDGGGSFGTHFRELVQLLFSSSSLLFVGYGLGDEDLLQPLRALGATQPQRKASRPLFALLPEAEPGADWHRHQMLFERYGLHVIPYSSHPDAAPEERGRELVAAIKGLGRTHQRWLEGWLEKPAIRRVVVRARPPRPYRHYSIDLRGHEVLGAERVAKALDGFIAAAREKARVLCLTGPGGGGKSWHAIQLMERVEREVPEFEGFFFWSSYYADDYLTGIDRALAYLDPHGATTGPRHERFAECLRRGRYFLVFDGFERLLRETGDPEVGEPLGKGSKRLLEALGTEGSRSTVVITTRLRPAGLGESDAVHVCRIGRLRAEDVRASPLFSSFSAHVPALCSLLDGHAYGLLLAGEYLRARAGESGTDQAARDLRRDLASSAPDRRVGRMIRLLVSLLDERFPGRLVDFLERVAVFMSPLTEGALRICLEEAWDRSEAVPWEPVELEAVIRELLASRLLFRVVASESERHPPAYTVHPTVRSYLFHRIHRTTPDMLPNFTLPGFTSGTAMSSPGSQESALTVRRLFERLIDQAETTRRAEGIAEARDLCRNAFSVLRSRLEAITAPRWTSYAEYLRLGLRLANLAKNLAPRVWDYQERHLLGEVESPDGPLFADELAWLYNDIGLALCGEGDMHDTYGVWEQGYELNRLIEGGEAPGQYVVQSQLHLAHTFIEMGLLQNADQYLLETERSNRFLEDQDYQGRIVGYRGLIAHLRGDWGEADDLYRDATRIINEAGGNPRAEGIFQRFHGDLKLARGEYREAADLIWASRAVAEAGHHPDLIAFAIKSRAHLHRSLGEFREARLAYDDALARARKYGIRRLEADILSELSRLALDLGDIETARRRAIEAMSIANELGLGLRQTHGLVVLGIAALRGGQRELGFAYLRHACSLATRQQYWSRRREAEQLLRDAGEPVDFEW